MAILIRKYQQGSKLITYENNSDLIDGVADWSQHSKGNITPQYNEQIKKALYTGAYGLDPESGALVKLNKPFKVPDDVKDKSKSITEKYYKQQATNRFVQQGHKQLINNPITQVLGSILFPPAGVMQGVAQGVKGVVERDYLSAGMGALEMIPFLGKAKKLLPKISRHTVNDFKSEIDWSKWNKDTPNHPELMSEYNKIERLAKKRGRWMKNSDGSEFQGTPEQFVQQQSSYFKKSFPDYYGKILYHNSPNKFNKFSEDYFGSTDPGYFGKGIYATEDAKLTRGRKYDGGNEYGPNEYDLYVNSKNPFILKHSFYDEYDKIYSGNPKTPLSPLRFNVGENKLLDEHSTFTIRGITGDGSYRKEVVIPFGNTVKSAKGNVGFFDMTNPDIYKTILYGAALGGAASQSKSDDKL